MAAVSSCLTDVELILSVRCCVPAAPEHGPGIDIFTPGKPGEYDLEGGIWEDEDARNFYENLVDLKAFVPAILFKDNEKSSQGKDKDEARGTCSQTLEGRAHRAPCSDRAAGTQMAGRPRRRPAPPRSWSWSWSLWTSRTSPWSWRGRTRPRTRSWPRSCWTSKVS